MDNYTVCMVIHEFYPIMAGAELFVCEVSKRLVQRGYTVHVVTRHHKSLPKYEKIQGIHVHRVPYLEIHYFRSVSFYLPAYLKILQLIKKRSIDIIHGHIPRSGGFIASLIKKTTKRPCVVTVQGLYRKDIRFARFIIKFALKNATLIHSTSYDLKKRIKQLYGLVKVLVIPNGVDTKKFNPNVDGSEIRALYALDNSSTVLTVSRLVPKNGIKYLLLAFPSVLKMLPNTKLLIAGDGWQRAELIDLANKLHISESVIFLGFQEHSKIPKLLTACDLFVRPSVDEGFGIVFLEAMACETPTIATKVGGITDIIIDGETGILISPENPKELSKAIIRLLQDKVLARKLAKNGQKMVKDHFTWLSVVEKLNMAYKMVLKSS